MHLLLSFIDCLLLYFLSLITSLKMIKQYPTGFVQFLRFGVNHEAIICVVGGYGSAT